VEACIGPFGDNVNLNSISVHGLCQMYHRLKNHFDAPDDTPTHVDQVEAHFYPFGDSVNVDTR
jgi:hypothetical protein